MSGIDAPADPHVPYPSAPDGSEAKAAQVDGVEKEAAVAVKPGDAGAAPAAAGDATEKPAAERPVVSISELFQYADGVDRALMVIGGVGAFINGAGMPAFADVFGRMIDELVGSPEEMEKNMAFLAALMCYIGIGVFALSALQVACYMVSSSRQVARIRRRYFAAVVRQEVAWHDEHKPGALAARLVGDTKLIQAGINDKLAGGMMNFGMFIFGFGLGFFHSWELTLVMFGTMPLIALTGGIMEHVLTKMTVVSRQGFANAGEVATEAMDNIRTVQVFGTEEKEVARFAKRLAPARIAGIRKEFTASAGIGLSYCIIFSSYSVAFWFASYLIEWKRNTVGEIMAVFFSVLMGSFGMGLMFPSFTSLTEARAAAYSIYEVINRKIAIDVDAPGASIEEIKGGITFEHVAFSYPTRKDMTLFTDLNVTIPKGAKVAFSGASGCGKSSIVGLLQRFYDPDSGSVRVDGVDMRDLQVREWRSLIGIVSQEPSLFSGSVKENIRLGKPDATDAEIEEACRKANIHDTIMTLPKQYDTPVGNVGSQLSGGQKQRIAIARAIIKNPKLLILDEATSALDRKSEVEVQAALDEVMQSSGGEKLTVVIIAHRLATIRNVDCIHYITYDGETGSAIAESGTYDELMARGGHFAIMASRQEQEDESASPTKSPGTMLTSASSPSNAAAAAGEDAALTPSAEGKRQRGARTVEDLLNEKTLEQLMQEEIERADAPLSRVALLVEKKWAIAIGIVGSIISGGLYPAYAVVLANMLEVLGQKADKPQELREETPLWASMFIVVGFSGLIGWSLQGFYGVAGEYMTEKIRIMLFRAILRQDATFFDTPGRDPGSLSGLLAGETESVHLLFGPSLGLKIQMMCNISAGIIIAMIYSWKLALVTIACIPVMVMAGAVNQMVLVGFGKKTEGTSEDTIVAESLNNIRTVVSFNFQGTQSQRYHDIAMSEEPGQRKTGMISGCVFGFSQFTFYGVFALSFWYGGKLIVEDGLTFTDIMIASMAVLMGAMGAGEAGGFAAKTVEAGAAAKKVFAVIDRVPKVDPQTEGRVKDIGPGASIELHHVHFRYPARPAAIVLDGLSVNFEDRKSVGLIGSTGCGKSTIMQLLCRFYDPEHGKILINGHNLRDIDVRTWRKECSIVLQEPALFSGTIRENITYGVDDEASVTDDEVERVARWAAIYDDVMKMPDGFNTQVGYKGRQLSGGQKQRVAIARGLLRKPRLMYFDEATSALDAATERRVMEGIAAAAAAHPMGMISIAHRLTTIEKSDKIVVLDAGEIIEEGSHGELMAIEGGEYRKRYTLFVQGMEAASALTSPSAAASAH